MRTQQDISTTHIALAVLFANAAVGAIIWAAIQLWMGEPGTAQAQLALLGTPLVRSVTQRLREAFDLVRPERRLESVADGLNGRARGDDQPYPFNAAETRMHARTIKDDLAFMAEDQAMRDVMRERMGGSHGQ